MEINILVCDDEQKALNMICNELQKAAEETGAFVKLHTCINANDVVDMIMNNSLDYDVLFLDIDMSDVSGLEIARMLRKNGNDIMIFFVSAHEQYVFEAIEYNPFRYIRKNRMDKEIAIGLKSACARLEELQEEYIIIKTGGTEVRIKNDDIMYFELVSRKIEIHLKNDRVLYVRTTIRELIEELNDEHFIKLHSGCVVNVRYISAYSNYDVTLDNGETLIVSRTRVRNVKTVLTNYWGDKT